METKTQPSTTITPQKETEWRGYTMDELEHRRAVNAIKTDLLKEQMNLAYQTSANTLMGGSGQFNARFNKTMTYASYGIQVFKYARSFFSLLRSFRKG